LTILGINSERLPLNVDNGSLKSSPSGSCDHTTVAVLKGLSSVEAIDTTMPKPDRLESRVSW
jgi:hypothetical protein